MAGYELQVDHRFDGTANEVFDGFLEMYREPRPDWIVDSQLDLRVGGTWDVVFHPPGVGQFREHRVLTVVDRPRRLGYSVTIIRDTPQFDTDVMIRIDAADQSHVQLTLTQSGFPDTASRDEFADAWPYVLASVAEGIADRG